MKGFMGFMLFFLKILACFRRRSANSRSRRRRRLGSARPMHWQRSTTCPTTASCSKTSSPTFPSTTIGTKRQALKRSGKVGLTFPVHHSEDLRTAAGSASTPRAISNLWQHCHHSPRPGLWSHGFWWPCPPTTTSDGQNCSVVRWRPLWAHPVICPRVDLGGSLAQRFSRSTFRPGPCTSEDRGSTGTPRGRPGDHLFLSTRIYTYTYTHTSTL